MVSLLSFPFPEFPAVFRFPSPQALPPRSLDGQSSTKEAFAGERGDAFSWHFSKIIWQLALGF